MYISTPVNFIPLDSAKMEVPLDPESCKETDMLKNPGVAAIANLAEDSGYLSQSQCSSLDNSNSNNTSASFCSFLQPVSRLSSSNDGITTPSDSMELSDSCSIESGFSEPKSKALRVPVSLLLKVPQSTPAIKRLRGSLHEEFNYVNPLPGPSSSMSSQYASLAGQTQVDILSQLSKRRVVPPLCQILSYLEPSDLCQLRLVSSAWRNLLHNFPHLKVWQNFVRERQQNKENSLQNIATQEELLVTPISTRSQLRDIHNFALVPAKQHNSNLPVSPPVSPSKLLSSLYVKEGQKLKSGEKLRKCPKCAWPSRVDSCTSGVRCTSRRCGFHFCVDCSGPFHDAAPCAKATPVTPTKARNRGNKLYKKRLRRLLY